MKKYLIIILMFSFCSCGLIPVKTTITTPNKEVYIVKSKSDALVVLKQGDIEMTVDNRGKPSLIEQLAVLFFGSVPKEITVE